METLDITPITEEEEEGGSVERGASILEGYFDSSHSTIEEETEKENETPCNMSDISPVTANKRRSESPAKEHRSPTKRHAGLPAPRDKVSAPVRDKVSPATPAANKASPAVTETRRKAPMSRSPLSCLKGTPSFKRGEVSPAEPDFIKEDSPITVRPKPKFKVVNGKLMPI